MIPVTSENLKSTSLVLVDKISYEDGERKRLLQLSMPQVVLSPNLTGRKGILVTVR